MNNFSNNVKKNDTYKKYMKILKHKKNVLHHIFMSECDA